MLTHPGTLSGDLVRLEPLSHEHHDGLVEAVRDGELWNLWYTMVARPEAMRQEIDRRLALQEDGSMIPFTSVRADTGEVLGMTTFMNIEATVPRVEIGSTWNRLSAQGSGTNAEAKLMMLGHAFDVWGCIAVEFRTDYYNQQSRQAIARLGARQDGILRSHRNDGGYLRDTVVFSIVQQEWSGVKKGLELRLAKRRG
ncbi:GNAT family N-acetyltransferase [Leucobacter sp. UCMA 4100]|uniref:GNAT family N-acetyltransferase n=1 Tax=Leucobacter sp. UCMA 4100 TaxID=2810534 RepID=UPI0022EB143C|nr:GNAT family protein [Leucobacter sp. UCMA 4100]MDA3146271.1 GNAT family N-acetyltransferase [Leucobacter sp. UCMA 4100]